MFYVKGSIHNLTSSGENCNLIPACWPDLSLQFGSSRPPLVQAQRGR